MLTQHADLARFYRSFCIGLHLQESRKKRRAGTPLISANFLLERQARERGGMTLKVNHVEHLESQKLQSYCFCV